jgi:hypothetical protein
LLLVRLERGHRFREREADGNMDPLKAGKLAQKNAKKKKNIDGI